MKINISLKDEQKEFMDQVINDYSLENTETSIQLLVSEILDKYDHESVFGEIRCIGGCFSTDAAVPVELGDQQVLKMKEIFQQYEFEDYDSEEEELSKIVRSMINYADQEADLNKLFSEG
ncbi:MAG: hypothetical protein MAG581_00728 [Deltaproteobacteria bacterium]|jgi:hypothetical protein|nr:hypothetical protein [Deltaproteobacteria bacterium]